MIGKQLLPEHAAELSPVTWALTCLLHDIGTAEEFFTSTRMSFDIYGGIKAMEVLKVLGSTNDQAEAVAEAIIRHEDMGIDGTITFMGQLIQLATLYDNVGKYEGVDGFGDIIHEITREASTRLTHAFDGVLGLRRLFVRRKETSLGATPLTSPTLTRRWKPTLFTNNGNEKLGTRSCLEPV